MIVWLGKIWLYGGWFYLSLVISVGVVYCFPSLRKLIGSVVLVLALGWAGWLYGWELSQLPEALKRLTLRSTQKKEVMTFGQVLFWEELERVLPREASGCLFASWDVPTHFLKQRLYPRQFKVIREPKDLQGCTYAISQFESRNLPGYTPVLVVKDNVLYQKQQ